MIYFTATEGFNYTFKHIVYTGNVTMFNLRYQKKLCIQSHDALKDMARHDVLPIMVEEIVLDGTDFKDKMRVKGEIGRSIKKGNFEIFVKLIPSYSYSIDEDVWVIKHIGKRRIKK